MANVMLVGESWFVHSIHQKGFDTFTSSEYEEGGGDFVAALEDAGHHVTRVAAHRIDDLVPTTPEELAATTDVVVISDVGANSFQLPKETFKHSTLTADRTEVVRRFVEAGGGLLMVGGYMTFTGIDAKARWGRVPLGEALPVTLLDHDDRVELPAGATPKVVSSHSVVAGLDPTWPALLGLNQVNARDGAEVLAECAGQPLLVVGEYGLGRSAAFTSDIAPHWAPPEFVSWGGYRLLFDQLTRWLASGDS